MSQVLKTLGQLTPLTGVLTALYTCPAANGTAISSVIVVNTDVFPSTFRLSLAVAAAANAVSQYIYYDLPIAANDTFIATIGLTLGITDQLRCQSASGKINFIAVGVEDNI